MISWLVSRVKKFYDKAICELIWDMDMTEDKLAYQVYNRDENTYVEQKKIEYIIYLLVGDIGQTEYTEMNKVLGDV